MTPPVRNSRKKQPQSFFDFATFETQQQQQQYQHQQKSNHDEPIAKRLRVGQHHQGHIAQSAQIAAAAESPFVAVSSHQQQQRQTVFSNLETYNNFPLVYGNSSTVLPYSTVTATTKVASPFALSNHLPTIFSNQSSGHFLSTGNYQQLQQHQQQQLYANSQTSGPQLIHSEDMYFFKNNENNSDFSKKRARQFFNAYTSTSDPELIEPDGIEKLCTDLQLKTDDPLVLVLSWKLKAKVMGMYTFSEWLEGMAELKCDTLPKLRNKLTYLQSCLNDPATFKTIYRYSFEFAKENEQRYLEMTIARQMMAILLAPRWRLFPLFSEFLSTVKYRVLNKDQYFNVLDFSRSVNDDLLNYDEESAWPVIMDEFVEYCREVKGFPTPSSSSESFQRQSETSGQHQNNGAGAKGQFASS